MPPSEHPDGGRYEWLWDGKMGSNDCQVLSFIPNRMISFELTPLVEALACPVFISGAAAVSQRGAFESARLGCLPSDAVKARSPSGEKAGAEAFPVTSEVKRRGDPWGCPARRS